MHPGFDENEIGYVLDFIVEILCIVISFSTDINITQSYLVSHLDILREFNATSLVHTSIVGKMMELDVIAPAGFWPRGQNPRRHYRDPRVIENMYGITR